MFSVVRPFSLLLAVLAVSSTYALLRLFGHVKTSDRIASFVDVVIQSCVPSTPCLLLLLLLHHIASTDPD